MATARATAVLVVVQVENIATVKIVTWAKFQITGDAYDRKKLRWLFKMPRHHAAITRKPIPIEVIRVRSTVRSYLAPSKLVKRLTIGPARRTSSNTITDVASAKSETTELARAAACLVWPFSTNFAYTGTNEADSDPSPRRFCKKFGTRMATRNASAAAAFPSATEIAISRTIPATRDSNMPAATSWAPLIFGIGFLLLV